MLSVHILCLSLQTSGYGVTYACSIPLCQCTQGTLCGIQWHRRKRKPAGLKSYPPSTKLSFSWSSSISGILPFLSFNTAHEQATMARRAPLKTKAPKQRPKNTHLNRSKICKLPLPRIDPDVSAASSRKTPKICAANAMKQAEHGFLAAMYREIDAAATDDSIFDDTDMDALIRRARLAQFLATLPAPTSASIFGALGPNPVRMITRGTSSIFNNDMMALDTLECRRLRDFYQAVGRLIMPVCLCSSTFRARLR
jgi:hypothetical protein